MPVRIPREKRQETETARNNSTRGPYAPFNDATASFTHGCTIDP